MNGLQQFTSFCQWFTAWLTTVYRIRRGACQFVILLGIPSLDCLRPLVWSRVASCRVASCRVATVVSCRVVSCRVCVVSHRVVSRVLRRVVLRRVASCRVASCRVVLCRVVLCRVGSGRVLFSVTHRSYFETDPNSAPIILTQTSAVDVM